jgi:hypothetical protein
MRLATRLRCISVTWLWVAVVSSSCTGTVSGGPGAACSAGASCTPTNACHAGSLSCSTGAEVCVDSGNSVADGTACGTNLVCSAGACVACSSGASCTPTNACHVGGISCSTGTAVCVDSGNKVTDGTACGASLVCSAGICISTAATNLTQNGITVTLDKEYTMGQYITGDYWVVDPGSGVTISATSHTPVAGVNSGESLTKNPRWDMQAYDSRIGDYDGSYALALPGTLHAGDTVVINTSLANVTDMTYLYSAIILNVVDVSQASTKFRPPYVRPSRVAKSANDTLVFDYASITSDKWNELPRKARAGISGLPTIAETQALIRGPWLDNTRGSWCNLCHPRHQESGYGRDFCADVSAVCTQLSLDYDLADLQLLATYLIQVGIDTYGLVMDGGSFNAGGGISSGRKIPLIFAAEMLDSPTLKSCSLTMADHPYYIFGEDTQTYRYDEACAAPYTGLPTASDYETWYDVSGTGRVQRRGTKGWLGILNGGDGDGDEALWQIAYPYPENQFYGHEDIPMSEWSLDVNGNYQPKSESYRLSCTSHVWVGEALLMLLWKNTNLIKLWKHDVFFDYVIRWMTQDGALAQALSLERYGIDIGYSFCQTTGPAWVKNVYTAYQNEFVYP